jgi:hypothetical protein
MPTTRHIIVCEGESEWAYLQRLQGFLDDQELPSGVFETPLKFIVPQRVIVKNGSFGKMASRYKQTRKENKKASIQIWADFDLYHRNDQRCSEYYSAKASGIPDFLFSFHNFEDFYALHFDGEILEQWLQYGSSVGRRHFAEPLHARDYVPEIERIFSGYKKGGLPADFVSWDSLRKLKANLGHQPTSNPHNFRDIRSFAEFLIGEVERAYPGFLDSVSSTPDPDPVLPVP